VQRRQQAAGTHLSRSLARSQGAPLLLGGEPAHQCGIRVHALRGRRDLSAPHHHATRDDGGGHHGAQCAWRSRPRVPRALHEKTPSCGGSAAPNTPTALVCLPGRPRDRPRSPPARARQGLPGDGTGRLEFSALRWLKRLAFSMPAPRNALWRERRYPQTRRSSAPPCLARLRFDAH
jgi:hypothetical protein